MALLTLHNTENINRSSFSFKHLAYIATDTLGQHLFAGLFTSLRFLLSNEARRLNDFCMVLQKFVKRGEGKESTSLLSVWQCASISLTPCLLVVQLSAKQSEKAEV